MAPETLTGAWLEQAIEWYTEPKDSCEVCGRLIPARRWVFASGASVVTACTPECETLYFDYVVPLRGPIGGAT